MTPPTCLIADDEPHLRQHLRELLGVTWPALQVVCEAEDGLAALRFLQSQAPNIAFLDIRMPGVTGLELARAVSGRCHVVFVTAYDEHAVAAFEAGVVDYVLKPLEPPRLVKVIERLRAKLNEVPIDLATVLRSIQAGRDTESRLQYVQASAGHNSRFIHIDEVFYFQSDAKYTKVVTKDGEALIRTPIKELAELLDGNEFWQIHRGTIVNVRHLQGVSRESDGTTSVLLRGRPERLPVSHPYHHRFRQM